MRSRRRVCQIIACQRCRQQHRYQEQWTKRTISCSLIRGGPIGKVLVPVVTEMLSTMATRVTDEVVHRGVYISREASLLRYFHITRKVKQTNRRDTWLSDESDQ